MLHQGTQRVPFISGLFGLLVMDLSWGFGFVSLDYELSVWALVVPQDFEWALVLVWTSSYFVGLLVMGFSHKNFPMCACKTLILGSRLSN